MNGIAELKNMGVTPSLVAGQLKLKGLGHLDKDKVQAAIALAKEHRDKIIAELSAVAVHAYQKLLGQVRAGTIVMLEYPGAWLRPRLAGQADVFAIQDLFQTAMPELVRLHAQDVLRELKKAANSEISTPRLLLARERTKQI